MRACGSPIKSSLPAWLVLALTACGSGDGAPGTADGNDAASQAMTAEEIIAAEQPGQFGQQRFTSDDSPARDYYVYVPANLPAGGVPLVVYLHGCNQTAPDAALGTRWNLEAEEQGFIVVYPEQLLNDSDGGTPGSDGNGIRCWNWFLPEHQNRGAGEPATIAGITREVMAQHAIDPERVYVLGVSAGGNMTSIMGATYPDLYAAIGVGLGCGYAACADASGSLAARAMGEHARVLPVFVFHGTADTTAPFILGENAVHQWLSTNDRVDDGSFNSSVSQLPASSEDREFQQTPGMPGDLCVRNRNNPCPGGVVGLEETYPHTIQHYVDANGDPLLDFWIIHGMAHNYPNGDTRASFTDPLGPDITSAAYRFFLAHPKA